MSKIKNVVMIMTDSWQYNYTVTKTTGSRPRMWMPWPEKGQSSKMLTLKGSRLFQ